MNFSVNRKIFIWLSWRSISRGAAHLRANIPETTLRSFQPPLTCNNITTLTFSVFSLIVNDLLKIRLNYILHCDNLEECRDIYAR